jgi:hypothetical protein
MVLLQSGVLHLIYSIRAILYGSRTIMNELTLIAT